MERICIYADLGNGYYAMFSPWEKSEGPRDKESDRLVIGRNKPKEDERAFSVEQERVFIESKLVKIRIGSLGGLHLTIPKKQVALINEKST